MEFQLLASAFKTDVHYREKQIFFAEISILRL